MHAMRKKKLFAISTINCLHLPFILNFHNEIMKVLMLSLVNFEFASRRPNVEQTPGYGINW